MLVVALFSIGNPTTSSLWVNNDYWLDGWGFAPHDLVDSLYSESKVNFSPSAFLLPVYFQLGGEKKTKSPDDGIRPAR